MLKTLFGKHVLHRSNVNFVRPLQWKSWRRGREVSTLFCAFEQDVFQLPVGPKTLLKKKEKGKTSEDKQGVIVEEESNQCFSLTWEISVIILFLYSLPLPRDSISSRNSRRSSISQRTAKRSRIQEMSNDGTSPEPTAVNACAHASV